MTKCRCCGQTTAGEYPLCDSYECGKKDNATDFEGAMKSFAENVEAAAAKAIEQRSKKLEAVWANLAGAVNNAGVAKANLNEARKTGDGDLFVHAQEFRSAEVGAVQALHAAIDLISEETYAP